MDLTESLLNSKRLEGDALADSFVQAIFARPELRQALYDWLTQLQSNKSLKEIPEFLQKYELITSASALPQWADPKLLKAGTSFFSRYSEQIMQLLGVFSLPYCYAAADGAMVLYMSHRLRNDAAKRLKDTGEFVMNVQSTGAFEAEGKALSSILKIRITHSAARYYTVKSGKRSDQWGIPVNQEDMAGTNLAFSLIVVRGLRKLGFSISYEDQASFMHLWAVIGSLLGITEDLIPQSGKEAFNLEGRIRERQFKASEHGRELTKSLIQAFGELNADATVSAKEIKQLMCYLLEPEVSEILGISDAQVPVYMPFFLKTLTGLRYWTGRIN